MGTQEQADQEPEQALQSARSQLGLACILAGVLLAWGYWQRWSGPVKSAPGQGLSAELAVHGRLLAGLAVTLLSGLGLMLLGRPRGLWARLGRLDSEWGPVLVVFVLVGSAGMLPGMLEAAGRGVEDEATGAKRFEVEVVGQQFEWLVRYPGPDGVLGRAGAEFVHTNLNPIGLDPEDPAGQDDVLRRSRLKLPLGEPCSVHLRSLDVLHRFNVEDFRVRVAVLPGHPRQLSMRPLEQGSYEVSCAGLCGLGHYRMRAELEVLPREELERWLAEQEPWF